MYNAKIFVAGHTGLVGSALCRHLEKIKCHIITRTKEELDLRDNNATNDFFAQEKPDYVFLAAAQVGGILANMTYPATFLYDNLAIELSVIQAAYVHRVKKLLFFGSSCIYPRLSPQPITEESLLTGPLEPTNAPYAIAKISGIMLCQAYNKQYGTRFISCMPTNLYGPYDTFDEKCGHVIPALIARFYRAMIMRESHVTIWSAGTALREFLFVDDLAQAALFLMDRYDDSLPINVGSGDEITIADLAHLIKEIMNYQGDLHFDTTQPEGVPRKLVNSRRINALGWKASTSLVQGITTTIAWYQQQYTSHASSIIRKSYEQTII